MIQSLKNIINEDYFSKLANRKDSGEIRRELGKVKVVLPNGKKVLEEDFKKVLHALFPHNACDDYIEVVDIADDGKLMVEWKAPGRIEINQNNEDLFDSEGNLICYIVNTDKYLDLEFVKIPRKGLPKTTKGLTVYSIQFDSLEGLPEEVNGEVIFDKCEANTRDKDGNYSFGEFFPQKINGTVTLVDCDIDSLYGLPEEINGNLMINSCYYLENLNYLPKKLNSIFMLENKNVWHDNMIDSVDMVDLTFDYVDRSCICLLNLDKDIDFSRIKSNCSVIRISYDGDKYFDEIEDVIVKPLTTAVGLNNLTKIIFNNNVVYKE